MTNEALPETDEIKAKATETAQSRRLEIERITEIVLAVLDAHAKPPIPSVPWYGRWGKFLIDNWTFALSLLALGSLLGASLMYNASPLYYMKQLAASDRELNAKQAKFIFQQDQASRYVSLGKEFLDRGHFDDAFKAFDEALKFDENDVAAGLGKFKAELFKASANGEYDPEVIATWSELAKIPRNEIPGGVPRIEPPPKRPPAYDNLMLLDSAGVRIVAGTDAGNIGTLHGPSLHRELELMAAAGLRPMDILVSATRNAAAVMSLKPENGTLERGKVADLVILDADPLVDIKNTRKIFKVMKAGEFFQ